ncbi:MAG: 8-oxo-dGTP diphosphatase [Clostridia bacterium]|nr:8-oxo-dGTP diphosphatase [Clostridia bacterium]
MVNTTLCYIEKDGKYLMMHRIKKKNDINKDKCVGVGGKIMDGESILQSVIREIKEETGVTPLNLEYRGIITFVSDLYGTEYMHLFTARGYLGEIDYDCDEGELVWIDKEKIYDLPIWEGDKIFFRLLEESKRFFKLELIYQGDKLVSSKVEK